MTSPEPQELLLLLDFQELALSSVPADVREPLVARTTEVLTATRAAGVPIVRSHLEFRRGHPEVPVGHPLFGALAGSEMFTEAVVPSSLALQQEDIISVRRRVNAFFETDLAGLVRGLAIKRIIMAGVATNWAVEAAGRHAVDLDLSLVILEDCCGAATAEEHGASIGLLSKIGEISESSSFVASLREGYDA